MVAAHHAAMPHTTASHTRHRYFDFAPSLAEHIAGADLIISHAGAAAFVGHERMCVFVCALKG